MHVCTRRTTSLSLSLKLKKEPPRWTSIPSNNKNTTPWLEWSKVNNFNPVVTESLVLGPLSLQPFEVLWLWNWCKLILHATLISAYHGIRWIPLFWSMDVTYLKSQNCHDKQHNFIKQLHDALFSNKETVVLKL